MFQDIPDIPVYKHPDGDRTFNLGFKNAEWLDILQVFPKVGHLTV